MALMVLLCRRGSRTLSLFASLLQRREKIQTLLVHIWESNTVKPKIDIVERSVHLGLRVGLGEGVVKGRNNRIFHLHPQRRDDNKRAQRITMTLRQGLDNVPLYLTIPTLTTLIPQQQLDMDQLCRNCLQQYWQVYQLGRVIHDRGLCQGQLGDVGASVLQYL